MMPPAGCMFALGGVFANVTENTSRDRIITILLSLRDKGQNVNLKCCCRLISSYTVYAFLQENSVTTQHCVAFNENVARAQCQKHLSSAFKRVTLTSQNKSLQSKLSNVRHCV